MRRISINYVNVARKTFSLIIAACVASTSAHASGWGTQTTITGFFIDSAAGVLFLKTANNQNIDSCTSSSYLSMSTSDTYFKQFYATIAAAHFAGSTVSLLYSGCSGSYPKITSVAVPNVW